MKKAISVGALPLFILSLVVLALERSLISKHPAIIAGQLLGLALMVWARASFPRGSFRFSAEPGGSSIVRTGPYRFVRHPIYAGALLLLWISIAGHPSIRNVSIGLIASIVVIAKIILEERFLRAAYPDYMEYARSTRALIPFVL
jgi:protein-S-isoprenylcysteine O-methyltransferase Ste14